VQGSNWHLAFAIRSAAPPYDVLKSTTILANEGRGVTVYESTQPITQFAIFDTTGYATWLMPHNNDTTWDIGALNSSRTTSATDYGWGEYDITSHDIVGTKLFSVRVAKRSGNNATYSFKKLKIEKLAFDTSWVFTYANLDNSNARTITINKPKYAGKLFAYHNILNDTTLDREPATKWDLLFTRYGANATQFGQTVFSTNTGALSYPKLLTSKVASVPTDSAKAGVYAHNLTGVGTDWKLNPGPGQPAFVIIDSLSYFTKDETNSEYKLVFNAFRGASTGTIMFTKTSIGFNIGLATFNEIGLVNLYPNPAAGSIHIELSKNNNCNLSIIDVAGKTQMSNTLSDLNNTVDISALQSGIYFVRLQNNETQKVVRLVVQ
jgi:hypothetical protein